MTDKHAKVMHHRFRFASETHSAPDGTVTNRFICDVCQFRSVWFYGDTCCVCFDAKRRAAPTVRIIEAHDMLSRPSDIHDGHKRDCPARRGGRCDCQDRG